MTWWEDTWLQESFADYMGFEVAATVAGTPGTRLAVEAAASPARSTPTGGVRPTRSHRRPRTCPTWTPADNFDMISYAKGNAALRQLVTWLGDETSWPGLTRYLTRHRFGNATLEDLFRPSTRSPARRRDWAERWLRTTGFDTIRVARDGEVPVLTRDGARPHRFRVTAYTTR